MKITESSKVGLQDIHALALAKLAAFLAQLLSQNEEGLVAHAVSAELAGYPG